MIISFLILELVLAVYIRVAEIKIELPTYTFENTQNFWFDLDKNFGTRHLPNDTYRQKKYCFDVVYETNDEGFRDVNRSLLSTESRVVALGDSFTEGIGVNIEDRLTNQLQSKTEIPHLNFGLAGNFGPIQYMILYNTLASAYTHDAILVGILPANDFIDDDYDIALKVSGNRYKPFLRGTYPNYDVVYHVDTITKSKARPRQQSWKGKILKNFTHSYNMYRYLRVMQSIKAIPDDELLDASQVPSYFNYTQKQLNVMRFSIEKIKEMAGEKLVMVYTIPIEKEILAYRQHRNNPLAADLKSICDNIGVEYLDLLPKTDVFSNEEIKNLFLSCDGHWSAMGNDFATKHIKSYFSYYNK